MDGEKYQHIDHREHQTGVDTGVKGDKGCIKLLWARGESRRDGGDMMLGRMEREREEDHDKDGWTPSRVIRAEPPSTT